MKMVNIPLSSTLVKRVNMGNERKRKKEVDDANYVDEEDNQNIMVLTTTTDRHE